MQYLCGELHVRQEEVDGVKDLASPMADPVEAHPAGGHLCFCALRHRRVFVTPQLFQDSLHMSLTS